MQHQLINEERQNCLYRAGRERSTATSARVVLAHNVLTLNEALFTKNGFIHYDEPVAAVGATSPSAPPAIVPAQAVE